MTYVYFDHYGILHAVDKEDEAKESSRDGKYVQVEIANEGGYIGVFQPLEIYDRGNGRVDAYIDGNQKDGKLVSLASYPRIQEIVNQLLGNDSKSVE